MGHGAIAGMIKALGDTGHSTFLSPEQRQEQHTVTEGKYEGIGAEMQTKDGPIVVVAPIELLSSGQ